MWSVLPPVGNRHRPATSSTARTRWTRCRDALERDPDVPAKTLRSSRSFAAASLCRSRGRFTTPPLSNFAVT
jgi:hypothetical protein